MKQFDKKLNKYLTESKGTSIYSARDLVDYFLGLERSGTDLKDTPVEIQIHDGPNTHSVRAEEVEEIGQRHYGDQSIIISGTGDGQPSY